MDYQELEDVNLDRTLHARTRDARERRPKVQVVARGLKGSATAGGFRVDADQFSVCEDEGYRRALDCDVLFCCVDRPWPRSILNFIAYAHLIPVIDGGIHVSRTKRGTLRGADWKAHVITPSHRCMLCLKQYDPGFVGAERAGDLDDPRYIETLPEDHPLRANENVFGFSLGVASLELLQFLMLVVGAGGLGAVAPQNYHLVTGSIDLGERGCDPDCIFPGLVAAGDHAGHPGTGVQPSRQSGKEVPDA